MQHRQLNDPREICFRSLYCAHLFIFLPFAYYATQCLAVTNILNFLFVILFGTVFFVVRSLGIKYLEFRRLDRCFVHMELGQIEQSEIKKARQLLAKLEDDGISPRQRQEYRQQLKEIIQSNEMVAKFLGPHVRKKHPYLYNW